MADRSKRLKDFIAEQERMDAQTPEDRAQRQDGAQAQARDYFGRTVMPALEGLATDLDQQASRTAKASVLSKPESDDSFAGELRIDFADPNGDGRRSSEFVCRIDVRAAQGSVTASLLTTPRLLGGQIKTKPYKTKTLGLDATSEQIAEDVQGEYLTISGALREALRNRPPRPQSIRRG